MYHGNKFFLMTWKAWIACFVFVAALLCVQKAEAAPTVRQELTSESTIERVVRSGVLRVGFSTFVPWAMQNKAGDFIGFEVDVARRLANDLGVRLELVPTKWSGIIPALLTGKFDVLIGGMSVTVSRNLKVNFSIPYDHVIMDMLANKRIAGDKTTLEAYNNPDVTIVVRTGSSAMVAAKRALPKASFRYFEDEGPGVQEVAMGRAHAFVTSAPLPAFEALRRPEIFFRPNVEGLGREPIGFAITKSDVDTLNVLNNWIRAVSAEGWLAERKHYWFETQDWTSQVQ